MTDEIRFSDDLALPLDAITERIAMLAMTNKGKTHTAIVAIEDMLTARQQVVVFDPTDVYSGLRSSLDGQSAGYPITIFGGEHGDAPLSPTRGALLAREVVAGRFSCVFCTYGWDRDEESQFAADFMNTLCKINREVIHVVVDEADLFAPQTPVSKAHTESRKAMDNAARRAGRHGVGMTFISQRAALVDKNVLAQVSILIALGNSAAADLDTIGKWVRGHDASGKTKAMLDSLPSLPRGEAWVWSPTRDIFQRIAVRQRRTFDAGKRPKPGEVRAEMKVLAPVDIARIGEAMRVESAPAPSDQPQRDDHADHEEMRSLLGENEMLRAQLVDEQIDRTRALTEALTAAHNAAIEALAKAFSDVLATVGEQTVIAEAITGSDPAILPYAQRDPSDWEPHRPAKVWSSTPAEASRITVKMAVDDTDPANVARSVIALAKELRSGKVPRPQVAILVAWSVLNRFGAPKSEEAIAAIVGKHPRTSSFKNNLSALRTAGFLDGITPTAAGQRLVEEDAKRVTRADVRGHILSAPFTRPQRELLDIVIKHHSRGGIAQDALASALGKHERTSSFLNNVSALRGRGVAAPGWPLRLGDAVAWAWK